MKLPLPFPKCKKCGSDGSHSIHKGCGGKLYISPYDNIVSCSRCNEEWNIWDSTYYCSCGNVFDANDIKEALVNLLNACKQCADEIERQQRIRKKRVDLAEKSLTAFFGALIEKVGYQLGVATGILINAMVHIFKSS